ncbi:MAG: hypothetical protein R3228_05585 [Halioglobus sp.]|nr:hypothetical protein [Halioglobus sp.]
MSVSRVLGLLLAINLVLAPWVVAQDAAMESDWMELVKGARDSTTGLEVVKVEEGEEPDARVVTLAVPKAAVEDRDSIEEVLVVGRMPDKPEPLDIEYRWVDDPDNDNYGLLIYLSEGSNWPIRLYLNSEPGFAD